MEAGHPQLSDGDAAVDSQSPDLDQVWAQFNKRIPTERAAVEEIFRRLKESGKGLSCRLCGCAELRRNYGDRVARCPECKYEGSITTGTFFERVKKLRAHLGAIYLFERGISFNATALQRLIGTVYSSAHAIYQKVAMIIEGEMHENVISTSSAVFLPVVRRRSRLTPAGMPPAAEEEEVAQGCAPGGSAGSGSACHLCVSGVRAGAGGSDGATTNAAGETAQPQATPLSGAQETAVTVPSGAGQAGQSPASPAPSKDGIGARDGSGISREASAVLELIKDQTVQFEELHQASGLPVGELSAALLMLEIDGHLERLAGNQYRRVRTAVSDSGGCPHAGGTGGGALRVRELAEQQKRFKGIIGSLLTTFGGVSRKYLQNYLAVHWNQLNWQRRSAGDLLKLCLRSPPLFYADILAYISPSTVLHAEPTQA